MIHFAWILAAWVAAGAEAKNLRGLIDEGPEEGGWFPELRDEVAKFASKAMQALDIEGSQGGAPRADINTTASGEHLVEELLSNKKLTQEVRLKPNAVGLIEAGRIYDIYMKDAQVGAGTHVSVEDDEVHFVVEDLSVHVECNYDLRLTEYQYGESGKVEARLCETETSDGHGGFMCYPGHANVIVLLYLNLMTWTT
ncbi:unnamed protein product [Symbiodinium natans]|uniref:Uncharacterized protein n=1 Tax=Symbiodinium natans TaxID=878477 RepID=A0A812U3U5_9DINO|nr:unnamed protein product [Symbiodinium natans]